MSAIGRAWTDDGQAALYLGDCVEVLREMPAASVDVVITDPPYGLGFMGREWDTFAPKQVAAREASNQRKGTSPQNMAYPSKTSGHQGSGVALKYDESAAGHRRYQAWCEEWARQVLRVAKPGAHLLAFGAPRTYHRLASGIEDAGWEMRDSLAWLFGSGFPMSLNLSGEWDGWGTALKPSYEPIVLARAPLGDRSVTRNVEANGCGALHIAACRIAAPEGVARVDHTESGSTRGYDGGLRGGQRAEEMAVSRWPANVLLDEAAAEMLDEQTGTLTSGFMAAGTPREGAGYGGGLGVEVRNATHGDSGGASRFYYTGKASRAEREMGLEDMPLRRRSDGRRTESANPRLRTSARRNHHPTVKPLDLMRWLVRLATPPGGVILDPFLGSGTTGIAARIEGFRVVGIEREAEYLEIAKRRIHAAGMYLPAGAAS